MIGNPTPFRPHSTRSSAMFVSPRLPLRTTVRPNCPSRLYFPIVQYNMLPRFAFGVSPSQPQASAPVNFMMNPNIPPQSPPLAGQKPLPPATWQLGNPATRLRTLDLPDHLSQLPDCPIARLPNCQIANRGKPWRLGGSNTASLSRPWRDWRFKCTV